ncbi:hypothetical protein [Sulfoacidibacillus thermotolerans]|uniref:Uncharacterized protein n=1 Tax=Sulfoacidibacillus thermotolerans TaxID=1765684 RepID=A0A2U3D9V8_SULT2|nr:hypothetical protein [Sulfoacidibacillus thermotolerans]PWI58069.1 hypothetical protein BM613_05220 [Sulfoacidibacillus thermotolerans]
MEDDLQFDLNAASWRHNHEDELAYIEALATRLERSLPDLVVVTRDRKWFSKVHHVVKIELSLGSDTFLLAREGARFLARKAKVVRGIALSSEVMSLKEWLDELSRALSRFANEHEETRQTLEDFLL